jgi:outer membrane biosynthesis protein TonB
LNIQLTVNVPELSAAINNLANALSKSEGLHTEQAMQAIVAGAEHFVNGQQSQQKAPAQQETAPQQQPVQQAPTAVPTAPPVQQQTPTPVQQEQPPVEQQQAPPVQQQQAPPVQQQQSAVPTTEAKYTMQQLGVAATQLMDAGKIDVIHKIMAEFQVPALMELPEAQYGAFATKLREAGANI